MKQQEKESINRMENKMLIAAAAGALSRYQRIA